MYPHTYASFSLEKLERNWRAAIQSWGEDSRDRRRGLPRRVSVELAHYLYLIGGTYPETDRRFFCWDGTADGVSADGHRVKRFLKGKTSMSFDDARSALCSVSWMSIHWDIPRLREEVWHWWQLLDFLQAALLTSYDVKRGLRGGKTEVGAFRDHLISLASLETAVNRAKLSQFFRTEGIDGATAASAIARIFGDDEIRVLH